MFRLPTIFAPALGLALLSALPAAAERITDRETFLGLVSGRTLSRPLVALTVTPDGAIRGNGAGWDVTGRWDWQDGFFCRDLNWGGDDLGYNCQAVTRDGNRLRFISDRGAGESAAFTLR